MRVTKLCRVCGEPFQCADVVVGQTLPTMCATCAIDALPPALPRVVLYPPPQGYQSNDLEAHGL